MSDTQHTDTTPALGYVEYDSNNSGGGWWLKDEHWHALAAAGWEVDWFADADPNAPFASSYKDGRWLGALATKARRRGLSIRDAIDEFERVTGQDVSDEGCNCCGEPHSFTEYDSDDKYVRSSQIERTTSWSVSE